MLFRSNAAPPVESFAWFKDQESGSIPDSFSPQLLLPRVAHTDHGEYSCVARNPLGTERSKAVLLSVSCEEHTISLTASPQLA